METRCQIFHVCHANRMDSFICPGGTTFNQKVFVCDWEANVDCDSSPDFYFLNSRIGTAEPLHSSVVINFGSRTVGGSTAAATGGSTGRITRVGTVADSRFGSSSQARLKAVRPDDPTGKRSGNVRVTSNIRLANTLLPNTLLVEVPTFVAKETETSERPTSEAKETRIESVIKSSGASSGRQNILFQGKEGGKQKKSQTYGSRLREQGYLPESRQKASNKAERGGYQPLEGSGEAPSSSETGGYLSLDGTGENSQSTKESNHSLQRKTESPSVSLERGSYLPTEGPGALSPPNRGSYLPEESTDQPDSSNYLSEKPPQTAVTDASFLLPPPSTPDLPNSILGAFVLPTVDVHSPVPPSTLAPRLPPMNLLPLSNQSAPPNRGSRLPSTTESYGVLDEDEDEPGTITESAVAPSSSRQGFGRALRTRPKVSDQGKNAIPGGQKTRRPVTETNTGSSVAEFQYDFDRVRNALQERLRNIEPFNVPAAESAASGGAIAAPAGGSTRIGGVAASPWLYSLAKVPMQ